jgi:hypothetical protein
MRKQTTNRTFGKQVASNSTECPFTQPRVAVGAGHQQIDVFALDKPKQRIDRDEIGWPHLLRDDLDAMSREVPGDIPQTTGGSVASTLFQHFHNHDAVGFLQEWQRVQHGAARLAGVLPCDGNSPG